MPGASANVNFDGHEIRRTTLSLDPNRLPDMPELMIAGPGELHEEDLSILGSQLMAHYGDVWTQLHADALAALGRFLGAADIPYVIPGTGTTCLDAAYFNLFEAGQKVVVCDTGYFGQRSKELALAHRLEVVEVPVEVGAPIDPARIADVIDGAHGVVTVHVETATGVRHPIEEIARVAHGSGAVYMVDGIASVGGEKVNVDEMELDCLVTGTQKGLESPPGLGILALSAGGRARVEARSERPDSWYLDLKIWDKYRTEWGSWHPHPVTMPTALVMAMYSSIRRILDHGLDAWIERRAALAQKVRAGLTELGLDLVPEEGAGANLVVAAWADDPAAIQAHLLDNGVMISGGLTPTAGKAIRIGLMGRTATEEHVDRVLKLIGEALA